MQKLHILLLRPFRLAWRAPSRCRDRIRSWNTRVVVKTELSLTLIIRDTLCVVLTSTIQNGISCWSHLRVRGKEDKQGKSIDGDDVHVGQGRCCDNLLSNISEAFGEQIS